ncbi:MAG: hypothetical protein J6V72_14930 [Kiritimatiellae bacterium]|nr:hypothetical protein [Kiritimatiellia bacterium]
MVSELAKGDWLDLKAQGLNPTLEDFDRLNCIALRLKDGAETTCANFPRVGWAGDVPFFEPTFQAFAWYHSFAMRAAANTDTEDTLWAFALAHARKPHFFDSLTTPEAIDRAASAWADKLPVTRDEVVRACRYACCGFDDAEAAQPDGAPGNPLHRADTSEAARNLAALEERLVDACAKLHVNPDDLQTETQSRLARLCESAAVELGRPVPKNEARMRAEYDLTRREIYLRLKAEKGAGDV